MRKILMLLFFFCISKQIFAQPCDTTTLNHQNFTLSCGQACFNLNFQIPDIRNTTDYVIGSRSYNPFPYIVAGGSEDPALYDDDFYSVPIPLPFSVCLYGSTYNTAVVGSNGLVTFDASNASCDNAYTIGPTIPNNGGTQCAQFSTYYPKASIMGAYSDLDPRAGESPADMKIQWRVEGNAPNRKFIVSYYHVGTFGTSCTVSVPNSNTFQIVVYESTGLIDIFFENKSCLSSTNTGNAILGIQDFTRTQAVAAAGKNATVWNASNEGYRITPNGGTSQFVSCKLYTLAGVFIADATTTNTTPGLIDVAFPNICPPGSGVTQYVVNTVYNSCVTGLTICNSDTISVNRITFLPATTSTTPTTCGASTGTITVNVTAGNGTPPFQYSLDGGTLQTSNVFNNVSAGLHTVFVTDATGCSNTLNVVVTTTTTISGTATATNTACAGVNTGTITVTPNSTNTPFSFILDGGTPQTSNVFTGVSGGPHVINFSDASGCIGTVNITVGTDVSFSSNGSITNLSCNQVNIGSVTFHPRSSIAPFTFSSNGGTTYQTDSTFNGLAAGLHTFRIRNAVGCIQDTVITITEPTALTLAAIASQQSNCSNKTGEITLTAGGGTPAYQYSIDGGITYQPGNVFSNLPVGIYNAIQIKDLNGCIRSHIPVNVTLLDTMRLELGPDSTICVGQTVLMLTQTNAETDTFKWNRITPLLDYDTAKTPIFSPIDTLNYSVVAKWGICSRTDNITINVKHKPVPDAGKDTSVCYKTFAYLNANATNLSGTVNYAWAPASMVTPNNAANAIAWPDTSRYFYVTVTDNYGCNFSVVDSVKITMRDPIPAFAGNDTIAMLNKPHQMEATGGVKFLWTPASPLNNPFIRMPLATLTHDQYFEVEVSDEIGCKAIDGIFVKVYEGPTYHLPNAFSPNGDGLNEVFRPIPSGIQSTEYFRVFDRYGTLMFQTQEWMKGWNGNYQGKPALAGTYAWIIKGTDVNGGPVEMKGTVILIR